MDDLLSTSATADCSYNESKNISGSFYTKYYDEIITKLHLQARQEYEHDILQQQEEKLQEEEELHNQIRRKRILIVDDPDICMTFQTQPLSILTQNTITELTKNQGIINKIKNLNSQRNQINNLLEGIRQKATLIHIAIKDQQYDTRVDCCPTYWALMKRFV